MKSIRLVKYAFFGALLVFMQINPADVLAVPTSAITAPTITRSSDSSIKMRTAKLLFSIPTSAEDLAKYTGNKHGSIFMDVAIDSTIDETGSDPNETVGRIYVVDTYFCGVLVFNMNGKYLFGIRNKGRENDYPASEEIYNNNLLEGPGPYTYGGAKGVAIGPNHHIYMLTGMGKIWEAATDGSIISCTDIFAKVNPENFNYAYFWGIAVDANGDIFVTNNGISNGWSSYIHVYDSDYNHLTDINQVPEGRLWGGLNYIALSPSKVFFSDQGWSHIRGFNKYTSFSNNISHYGTGWSEVVNPYGVAVGPDGEVLGGEENIIQAFNPDGTFLYGYRNAFGNDSLENINVLSGIKLIRRDNKDYLYAGNMTTSPNTIKVYEATKVYSDLDSFDLPTNYALVQGATCTITGTASGGTGPGIQKVEISLDGGASWSTEGVTDTSGNGTWSTWSYNWTPPADGVYNVLSRATDNSAIVETPGQARVIRVDNEKPMNVLLSVGAVTTSPSVTLYLSAVDHGTCVYEVQISNDGVFDSEPWQTLDGNTSWGWTLSPGYGNKTIYARFKDLTDNISDTVSASTLYVDNVAPTTVIETPTDNCVLAATPVNINGKTYGGFSATVEVSTDGGTTWNMATPTNYVNDGYREYYTYETWSYSWTPPAEGSYTIMSRGTDYDINQHINRVETPGSDLNVIVHATYDNTSPASAITSPTNNQIVTGATYTISGTASDGNGSGVQKVEVSVNGGPWMLATGTTNWSLSGNMPADGIYSITSRATDNANHVGTPSTAISVRVDNTKPTSTIADPLNNAVLTGASYTMSGTASDGTGSGVYRVQVFFNGGSSWNDATGTTNWSYSANMPPDGTYTVLVRATDNAGNIQSPVAQVVVTVDNTP